MEIINQIKQLFNSKPAMVIETSNFKDVKTIDNVILRIEEDKVSILNEDGSLTDAPAGVYELEDGSKIEVADAGMIVKAAEIEVETPAIDEEVEVDAAEVAPVEAPVETPEEERGEEDKVAFLESKISELEAAIATIVEKLKGMEESKPAESEMEAVKDIKKENKELKKQVKEMSAAPAVAESNFKKVEFSAIDNFKKSNTKESNVNVELMNKIIALKENK